MTSVQDSLKLIGDGSVAFIYEVNGSITLKACQTYRRPTEDAPFGDWWEYSDATFFSLHLHCQEEAIVGEYAGVPKAKAVNVPLEAPTHSGRNARFYRGYCC